MPSLCQINELCGWQLPSAVEGSRGLDPLGNELFGSTVILQVEKIALASLVYVPINPVIPPPIEAWDILGCCRMCPMRQTMSDLLGGAQLHHGLFVEPAKNQSRPTGGAPSERSHFVEGHSPVTNCDSDNDHFIAKLTKANLSDDAAKGQTLRRHIAAQPGSKSAKPGIFGLSDADRCSLQRVVNLLEPLGPCLRTKFRMQRSYECFELVIFQLLLSAANHTSGGYELLHLEHLYAVRSPEKRK